MMLQKCTLQYWLEEYHTLLIIAAIICSYWKLLAGIHKDRIAGGSPHIYIYIVLLLILVIDEYQ